MLIRSATKDDLKKIVELSQMIVELHVENLPLFQTDLELEKGYRESLADESQVLLVAEIDGKVVGYALLSIKTMPEFYNEKYRDVLEVEEIGVDEKYRRRRVAKTLEAEAEKIARAKGINWLRANVYDFNRASQKLHENFGYKVLSRKYWKDLSEGAK